jgi:beta-galactosidase/beta-glucuronidase
MGVNALRTAHYQQDQKVYDLADERGYLVWTEVPLVNLVSPSAAPDTTATTAGTTDNPSTSAPSWTTRAANGRT